MDTFMRVMHIIDEYILSPDDVCEFRGLGNTPLQAARDLCDRLGIKKSEIIDGEKGLINHKGKIYRARAFPRAGLYMAYFQELNPHVD